AGRRCRLPSRPRRTLLPPTLRRRLSAGEVKVLEEGMSSSFPPPDSSNAEVARVTRVVVLGTPRRPGRLPLRKPSTLMSRAGNLHGTAMPAMFRATEHVSSQLQEKYHAPADLDDVLLDPRTLARARLRGAGRGSPEETTRGLDGNKGGTRRQGSRRPCRPSA